MTPEQFLSDYSPQLQELAHQVRESVKGAVPEIEERVYRGWRLIGYRVKTPRRSRGACFCYIAPGTLPIQLGFEYGVLLQDPDGLLEGEGKQVRFVTIAAAADLQRPGLPELIVEAARVAALTAEEKASLRLELEEVRALNDDR